MLTARLVENGLAFAADGGALVALHRRRSSLPVGFVIDLARREHGDERRRAGQREEEEDLDDARGRGHRSSSLELRLPVAIRTNPR